MKNSNVISRSAGILMAVSSLPSPYGIGTFGKAAYDFVDFVNNCNHHYWQVLPIGPTTYGDSPYQPYSAFAGNPYFVDLDMLVEEGMLEKSYIDSFEWGGDAAYVDYEKLFFNRFTVLRKAFEQFKVILIESKTKLGAGLPEFKKFENFLTENASWVEDYALFMSAKSHFNNVAWSEWDDDIRFRTPDGLAKYKKKLSDEIFFVEFVQYEFDKQWKKLKKYANEKGIEIIGDIPIYMGYDSSDVWANPHAFKLNDELKSDDVAGVPPDAFSDLGQKWGNPLYDWEQLEKDDFEWWRLRMSHSAKLYDVIRIDHFIGIVKYFCIPADMPDARQGKYRQGPGQKLIDVINESIGDKKIIAEDLGVEVPEVNKILKDNDYPGMKVLEFAFGGDRKNPHLPYNYEKNMVVYGGTHDNETLYGYFKDRGDWELGYAYDYLDTRDKYQMVDKVFRAAYGSVANLVVFATQDILKFDNWARMNFPSSIGNNWKWRLKPGQLSDQHIENMRYLASVFDREK